MLASNSFGILRAPVAGELPSSVKALPKRPYATGTAGLRAIERGTWSGREQEPDRIIVTHSQAADSSEKSEGE